MGKMLEQSMSDLELSHLEFPYEETVNRKLDEIRSPGPTPNLEWLAEKLAQDCARLHRAIGYLRDEQMSGAKRFEKLHAKMTAERDPVKQAEIFKKMFGLGD